MLFFIFFPRVCLEQLFQIKINQNLNQENYWIKIGLQIIFKKSALRLTICI